MKKIAVLGFAALLAGYTLPAQAMHKKKKKTQATNVAPTLEGEWQLTYFDGVDSAQWSKQKIPTLKFDLKKQSVSGNNSCNSFFGPVSVQGSRLQFTGPMGSTKMFCAGSVEEQFMAALARISSYSFPSKNEVDLISGDLGVMRLRRK